MYFLNQSVQTPYGDGTYLGLSVNSDEILRVQPKGWTMARDSKPTFFLNPKDVRPMYVVGSHVFTTYGEGTITAFREEDSMYIVELLNWALAQGQSPSLYLQEVALSKSPVIPVRSIAVKSKVPEPPKLSYAESCIAKAIAIKEEAGTFYKKADYQTAREKYLKALEAIQGIMLISALEERMEDGQVWKYLLERGMTKNKLIKEWKIKSYFLAGKSELLRKEYDTSIALLEAGLKILENDPSAAAEITKLKDLHLNASKKRSAELKKEKSTWAKAFQKNKEEPDVAPVVLMDEEVIVENAENFEEILKGMNAAPKKIKNTVKIVENVKEEEEVGEDVVEVNDDAVSDEAFGWLVGATTIIGVVAIAAFYLLKSKQR